MATYKDMQGDIADSVDDTTGEYTDQIKKAIQKAIRYCERDNFYFNETRDETFPTVAAREWYGTADNANIPTLVSIQALFLDDGSSIIELDRYEPAELELLSGNGSPSGKPDAWTYFDQQIRLYPVPDSATYTIRMQLGPYRLTPLAADTDTNAWLTEAYDMIFERAKFHLAADTLKDVTLATASLQLYHAQHDILKAETSERSGTGSIRPTEF